MNVNTFKQLSIWNMRTYILCINLHIMQISNFFLSPMTRTWIFQSFFLMFIDKNNISYLISPFNKIFIKPYLLEDNQLFRNNSRRSKLIMPFDILFRIGLSRFGSRESSCDIVHSNCFQPKFRQIIIFNCG